MHSQNQHDNTVKREMPGLLYTKTGYITVLSVSYKDNFDCRPEKFKFAYHLFGRRKKVYIVTCNCCKYKVSPDCRPTPSCTIGIELNKHIRR